MTTCSAIGLSSDTLIGSSSNSDASDPNVSGTVKTNEGSVKPGTGQEVDVAITGPSTIVVDAVVVKGANGYNSYSNPNYLPPSMEPDQHYIPPFIDGKVPSIGHWFACYRTNGTQVPTRPRALVGGTGIVAVAFAGVMWRARRRRSASAPA